MISILPLLIISASSLYIVIDSGQKNIIELQNLAIDNTSEKVQKYLNEKMDVFNLVISGPARSLRENDMNSLNYLMNNLKEMADDVVEISFVDRNGLEIVKSSDIGNYQPANISSREDFITAFSGRNYFSEVTYKDSAPFMRMASQIENSNREIIGVITALVDLHSLDDVIKNIKLGETGYVYLLDKNGKFITSSKEDFLNPGKDLTNIKEIVDILNQKKVDDDIMIYRNTNGEDVVLSNKKLDGFAWFTISEWPKNDAFKTINNLIAQSLMIILLTIGIAIILGLFIARQIIVPIKTLNNGVNKIAEGDLDYKIKLATGDEFEILADEFNKMTDVLKENRQLRDEFVFIAAHELRTPVTAIRGYLSMVLDESFGKVKDEIRKALSTVEKANNRLVQLVQDLLQVARSEAGKMNIDLKEINIKNNIKSNIEQLKSLSDEKGINVLYQELGKEIIVKADNDKLSEVLVNIIGNAIKYTLDEGGIEVYHEIDNDKKLLITHIKDHGMGMTKEEMEKLFQKFYRVQNDNTSTIDGTGLGLFICKEIIERMEGNIWVESEKGKGSIFSFSLKMV